MSKKTKTILFSAAILAAFLIAAWAVFRFLVSAPTPVPEQTAGGIASPANSSYIPPGSQSSATTSSGSTRAFTVKGEGGRTIAVNDFTRTAVQSKSNAGIKYLAGEDEQRPTENTPYVIFYLADDESFTVSLWSQPIGSTRARAQSDLLLQLGISESEACSLRYVVLVPFEVDKNYAGRNLGFSFCPGAVSLP